MGADNRHRECMGGHTDRRCEISRLLGHEVAAGGQAIHLNGKVPRQVEPNGAAAGNVAALTRDVMERPKEEVA